MNVNTFLDPTFWMYPRTLPEVVSTAGLADAPFTSSENRFRPRPMTRPVHQPDPNSALARRDQGLPRVERKRSRRPPAQGLRLSSLALAPDRSDRHSQLSLVGDDRQLRPAPP